MDHGTLDDMVGMALTRVFDDGLEPRLAAEKTLAELRPDADATAELLAMGLARLVNDRLNTIRAGTGRTDEDDGRPGVRPGRFQLRTLHGTEGAGAYYHLSKPYRTADGYMLPLLMFTAEDWAAAAANAYQHAQGWAAMHTLFYEGTKAMAGRRARTTAQLPATVLRALEAKAGAAFEARGRTVVV